MKKNNKFQKRHRKTSSQQSTISEYDFSKALGIAIRLIIFFLVFFAITFVFLLVLCRFDNYIALLASSPASVALTFLAKKYIVGKFLTSYKRNLIFRISSLSIIVSLAISSIALCSSPTVCAWATECSNSILLKLYNPTSSLEESTNTIIYNEKATFKINDSDLSYMLHDEHINKIYLSAANCYDNIEEYFRETFHSKEPQPQTFNQIQDTENLFLNRIQLAKEYKELYGINDEWYNYLPSENELIKIINAQEDHAESHPDFLIYYRLSNNYQRLALEYLNQEANKSTVKYYFIMSLLCDYHCIEYADTKKQYNIALNRIYYRYSDIYYECTNTLDEKLQLETWLHQLEAHK